MRADAWRCLAGASRFDQGRSTVAYADNNGVRLHWQEQGQGSPILLVMGHLYSSALWYPVIPALAAAHRVIWFDNRGTGESDTTPKVTVQELAADAVAVMDAAGVECAHIFGISMGGVIAIELAMNEPQRVASLVLGATGILSADKPRAPAIVRVLYYLPRPVLRLLMRGRTSAKAYGSAATPERIASDEAMLAKDKSNRRGVIAQAVAVSGHYTTTEAVAKLTMPALVLHGGEDSIVPVKWGVELAETLPNSRYIEFEGAGHNFLVARGDEAARAVLDFVRDVGQRMIAAG
jgi:3-oxoadipate enol-lactonase